MAETAPTTDAVGEQLARLEQPEGEEPKEDAPEPNPGPGRLAQADEPAAAPPLDPMDPANLQTQVPTASQTAQKKPPRSTPKKRAPQEAGEEPPKELPSANQKEYETAVLKETWKVCVKQLTWDLTCQYGQARTLDMTLAEHYFNQIKSGPPLRKPVRVLLWQKAQCMFKSYEEYRVRNSLFPQTRLCPWVDNTSAKPSV